MWRLKISEGRSLSGPPIHGPLRPMPRLLSRCDIVWGTQLAPCSATTTFSRGNRPKRLSKMRAESVSTTGRSP